MKKTILTAGLALLLPTLILDSAYGWISERRNGGDSFLLGVFRNEQSPPPIRAGVIPQRADYMPPRSGFIPPVPTFSPRFDFPQSYSAPGYNRAVPGPGTDFPAPDGFPSFYPVSDPGYCAPPDDIGTIHFER